MYVSRYLLEDDPKNVSVPSFCGPYNVSSSGGPITEIGQYFIRVVIQLSPVSKSGYLHDLCEALYLVDWD